MKLSDKTKTELHTAISNNIMKLRITNVKNKPFSSGETAVNWWDDQLFKLDNSIWLDVCRALNLEGN